jgi:hypothetical protein
MAKERRRNRSEIPSEAASLFLEALADRSNLSAVALAGADGLLLVGAQRGGYDCDALAALGVARSRGMSVRRELVQSIVGPLRTRRLHTRCLEIGGESFYLASVGERRPKAKEAAVALRRILGPSLTPVASA